MERPARYPCKVCGAEYLMSRWSTVTDYCSFKCFDLGIQLNKVSETIDHSEDITLIRACLRVLGAVDKKNAVLVSVALDALDRIEKGEK